MKIEIVKGVEGLCIYLNDYRIVGPKPWGGGTVVKSWDITWDDILKAIPVENRIVVKRAVKPDNNIELER